MEWVVSTTGSLPKGADRKRIRKQAMSNAARARRSRGNYGRSNVGQYPADVVKRNLQAESSVPVAADAVEESYATSSATEGSSSTRRAIAPVPAVPNFAWSSVPRGMSSFGYERMRMNFDFDVLDLSSLATFHIGQTAARVLAAEPSRLGDVLRFRQW